jgi:hypothetical protein
MNHTLLFLSLLVACNTHTLTRDEIQDHITREAFCNVPIADVVSRPLATHSTSQEHAKAAYKKLPISWGSHALDKAACPRIHQLLLHEVVRIIEETEHEVLVEIPHFKTINNQNTLECIKGWVLKENLQDVDATTVRHLPKPISDKMHYTQTLALKLPYGDSDVFYSAGTRFAILHEFSAHKETPQGSVYHAWAYDSYLKKFKIVEIPKQLCTSDLHSLSLAEKKDLFCQIVTTWATLHPVYIPLVWGGASIAKAWENNDYKSAYLADDAGQTCSVWERPKYGSETHQGIDASNLVARAAQIVGIEYEYRNTATAAAKLDELYMYEWPENGDLIWIPGGLLIINDLTGNRAVSAFSYGAGYGIVTEIPLARIFKDISTYEDFMTAYRAQQPLTILNKDGSVARTITEYKILRFARN